MKLGVQIDESYFLSIDWYFLIAHLYAISSLDTQYNLA